jgi:hypothetical protein
MQKQLLDDELGELPANLVGNMAALGGVEAQQGTLHGPRSGPSSLRGSRVVGNALAAAA